MKRNLSSPKLEIPDALPFLTSDFFADSLAGATTVEQDPMGTQRLLEENSRFSPSLLAGTNFPILPIRAYPKIGHREKNSTTLDLIAGLRFGRVCGWGLLCLCTPAASLMQMRNLQRSSPKI